MNNLLIKSLFLFELILITFPYYKKWLYFTHILFHYRYYLPGTINFFKYFILLLILLNLVTLLKKKIFYYLY